MQLALLGLLASMASAMVADMTAIGRAKHDYSMQVESSGDVEEIAQPSDTSDAGHNMSNWTCVSCCAPEHEKTRILYKPEFDTGLSMVDYTGYGPFNKERQAAFMKCGAITSQRTLYTNHLELFYAWGGVISQFSQIEFCQKACAPPAPVGDVHPARVLFQVMIAQASDLFRKADEAVITGSGLLAASMSPMQAKKLMKFDEETESKAFCRTGCFSGRIDLGVAAGKGTFCASATTASLSVCKTKRFASDYKGTCKNVKMLPHKSSFINGAVITPVGANGSCAALDKLKQIVCMPGNKYVAFLKGRVSLQVEVKSTCLLEEFAQDRELTIDEALDHPEHGAHAEDLLVDCYRHSENEGISLLERSRRDASHLDYQLEDRHMERAISLYQKLAEEDKKHQTVPAGYTIDFQA